MEAGKVFNSTEALQCNYTITYLSKNNREVELNDWNGTIINMCSYKYAPWTNVHESAKENSTVRVLMSAGNESQSSHMSISYKCKTS